MEGIEKMRELSRVTAALKDGHTVSFQIGESGYFIQPENNKGWDYLGLWKEGGFPVCIARAFYDVMEGITKDTVRELFEQPCIGGKTLAEVLDKL